MNRPVIDHRSPEFAALTHELLPKMRRVFGTDQASVVLYPASGSGAWEAALVNVLRPGDRVLAFNYGHFSARFAEAARRLGFSVDEVSLRWGQELAGSEVERCLLADDSSDPYRAVLVVHNETSTGVMSDLRDIRRGIDAANHDALLIVDAVSSLASVPIPFDECCLDICLAASQKGLMLPPGMAVVCVGPRAVAASEDGGSPRSFFDWRPILRDNTVGFFPYTPATLMLFGLRAALAMLVDEEGLEGVFERHRLLAGGVRAAVAAWGLRMLCEDPAYSSETVTAVVMPDGRTSGDVVESAREQYGLSLGVGLGEVNDQVFRIGHLGALNELEVLGTIAGIEMALFECGIDIGLGSGVEACQRFFVSVEGAAERTRPVTTKGSPG
jgi:alanine-glyoxylate transaminase/serine-glyoxylate transaminase/serine-pyruvate transaminase